MTVFRYKVSDNRGIEWDETIEADSREAAEWDLESRGLKVHLLRRVTEENAEHISFDLSADEVAELRRQKQRPTFGWPAGSVRALLTLMLVFYICVKLLMQLDIRNLWMEALVIAVAHYFTARRQATLPASMRRDLIRLELIDGDEHPLGLPQNSIRTIIFLCFAGLCVTLAIAGNPLNDNALSLLLALVAFICGNVVRAIWNLFSNGKIRVSNSLFKSHKRHYELP